MAGVTLLPSFRIMFRKLFVVLLAFALVVLLTPGEQVLAAKIWVASWLPFSQSLDQAEASLPLDKVVHGLIFASLAASAAWGWLQRAVRWRLLVGLVVLALGTEGLQYFIPQRAPGWADLAANLAGIALGYALAHGQGLRAQVQ